MQRWWDLWPGRLEYELEALRATGIPHELDKTALDRGRVIIRLWPTVVGEPLNLRAVFPDLYPYFRFELAAPDLDLPRHQHPFAKNLCLIGRPTENWRTTDTLAKFIKERLPQVLTTARSEDPAEIEALEERQGEPFSDYYAYRTDAAVLVDTGWALPDNVRAGDCVIGLKEANYVVRGAVLRIEKPGQTLAQASPHMAAMYPYTVKGRWVRVDRTVRENEAEPFLRALAAQFHDLLKPQWNRVSEGRLDIVAVAFPEELRWREWGIGWVFVVRYQKRGQGKVMQGYLVRAVRAGEDDLATRVPQLRPLRRRTVALFGAGALGSPGVLELARSGVGEIRILDHDFVDAPMTVRWPLGLDAVGLPKARALQQFVHAQYPNTRIKAFVHRLGGLAVEGPSDLEVLEEMCDGAHLIYDATAEVGIQHLLSDLALKYGIPYIAVSGTFGAWGGLVARVRPGQTEGCWSCLQHAINDGVIISPPSDPTGQIQPAGCADPTFAGAGFDLAEIALMGVRLAVGTLCVGVDGGYPDVGWDVGTLALRDEHGGVIAANWTTFRLDRHPDCQACAERHGSPG